MWFSIGAMLFLAASDYIVSLYGHMGVKMMMYYNIGPLMVCFIYFPAQYLGFIAKADKPLFKKKEGGADYAVIGFVALNVVVQASIILLLNQNFHLSILAGLNIGIA